MHAVCCAAKVIAWVHWVITSTRGTPANAATAANRSAVTPAASSSQRCADIRANQRPWNQNQNTSTKTPSAQISPICPLP